MCFVFSIFCSMNSETVNESGVNGDDELEFLGTIQTSLDEDDDKKQSKKAKTTSDVWNWFTKIDNSHAKCNKCGKVLVCGGNKYGTSTLSRHLTSCKKKLNYGDVSKMIINHEGKLISRKT